MANPVTKLYFRADTEVAAKQIERVLESVVRDKETLQASFFRRSHPMRKGEFSETFWFDLYSLPMGCDLNFYTVVVTDPDGYKVWFFSMLWNFPENHQAVQSLREFARQYRFVSDPLSLGEEHFCRHYRGYLEWLQAPGNFEDILFRRQETR